MVLRQLILPLFFLSNIVYYMPMIQLETLIFSNRQVKYISFLSKIRIAKLIKSMDCFDPLTDKLVCKRVLIEVPKIFENIYEFLLELANDEQGRQVEKRLIDRRIISKS